MHTATLPAIMQPIQTRTDARRRTLRATLADLRRAWRIASYDTCDAPADGHSIAGDIARTVANIGLPYWT